ncbi:hypothetical protein SPBR_09260 [Sporothrix brasiliensis 5110]|uniref:Uncharacterized protein n=1 Tax=Sporothrix brasiliensis 5110 TaxID=1398154 RepID=A0A0C2FW13_9PEZI|nr:uncharacterized protein SPBR_09260 [Sporothrix brasiliensis 5110]KIH95188.1 hypothetical protein SPBR_09260 [Sporothrix brasiliensis 5110]
MSCANGHQAAPVSRVPQKQSRALAQLRLTVVGSTPRSPHAFPAAGGLDPTTAHYALASSVWCPAPQGAVR